MGFGLIDETAENVFAQAWRRGQESSIRAAVAAALEALAQGSRTGLAATMDLP